MSESMVAERSNRKASGWIRLLVLFGIASTVEAFTVSHVFRFMPLYLATVHVPAPEVPAWTGYLNAAFFLFGLPLVPFWGVWSERYGRIPIIARSAFVEMVVFSVLWLAQNRWQAAFGLLLVGFQLGNTGVMLTALRAVTPRGRVGVAISLFGVPPSLGFALGPAIGGWLVDHNFLNLHTLFAVDAAMSLAAGVILLAFAREGPRPPAPPGSATQLALGALRMALTGRVTLIVFGVFGLAYFAQQIANPFLPLLVLRLLGGGSGAEESQHQERKERVGDLLRKVSEPEDAEDDQGHASGEGHPQGAQGKLGRRPGRRRRARSLPREREQDDAGRQ